MPYREAPPPRPSRSLDGLVLLRNTGALAWLREELTGPKRAPTRGHGGERSPDPPQAERAEPPAAPTDAQAPLPPLSRGVSVAQVKPAPAVKRHPPLEATWPLRLRWSDDLSWGKVALFALQAALALLGVLLSLMSLVEAFG